MWSKVHDKYYTFNGLKTSIFKYLTKNTFYTFCNPKRNSNLLIRSDLSNPKCNAVRLKKNGEKTIY